jgi:hypothetical protein
MPVKCPSCNLMFGTRNELDWHIREEHMRSRLPARTAPADGTGPADRTTPVTVEAARAGPQSPPPSTRARHGRDGADRTASLDPQAAPAVRDQPATHQPGQAAGPRRAALSSRGDARAAAIEVQAQASVRIGLPPRARFAIRSTPLLPVPR